MKEDWRGGRSLVGRWRRGWCVCVEAELRCMSRKFDGLG